MEPHTMTKMILFADTTVNSTVAKGLESPWPLVSR